MLKMVKSFVDDESGATAVEYGLIASLVSGTAIGALSALGGSFDSLFTAVSGQLNTVVGGLAP